MEHRTGDNERRAKYIHVEIAIDAARSADALRRLYLRRKHASAEKEALWDGYAALDRKVRECIWAAIERNQLLFCFEGTTVLQGGAA